MKTIKQLWTQQSSGKNLSEIYINVFSLFFSSLHYISLADEIAQLVLQLGYGLDSLGFKFWQEQEIFPFSKASHTNSEVHPKPHNKWVPGFFPRGNAAKAWRWPLTSTYRRGKKWVEAHLHFLYMPSQNAHRQLYLCGLPPIPTTYFV